MLCTRGNCIQPCTGLSSPLSYLYTHTDTIAEFATWNELTSSTSGPWDTFKSFLLREDGAELIFRTHVKNKSQNGVLPCLSLLRNTLWWCQWVHHCFCEPSSFTSGSEIPSFQFVSLILVSLYDAQSCYPRTRSSATVAWLWSVDEHICSTCVTDGITKTSVLENGHLLLLTSLLLPVTSSKCL